MIGLCVVSESLTLEFRGFSLSINTKFMKSIAGSIVVLAGAILLGMIYEDIPREPLPTLVSFGLMIVGLFFVFRGGEDRQQ